MSTACLIRQAFDSEVFGLPYYRMVRFDPQALATELPALAVEHATSPTADSASHIRSAPGTPAQFMADAKLPAQLVDEAKTLMGLGFRKVCVQAHFALNITVDAPRTQDKAEPSGALAAAPELLDIHAANLRYSRFGLDPLVPEALRFAHQRQWLANAMASETVLKFFEGSGFVSFTVRNATVAVDLFSVPQQRMGHGSILLQRLKAWCANAGIPRLLVTTECENTAACLFYEKNGFRLAGTSAVFHLLQGAFT